MLKDTLRKLGPEFGFLTEEVSEVEQDVMNRLDRSVKLDEVDTITFGLETDDGKIVKVYVKVDQAEDFEKALAAKLGEIDDIEEVLNTLSKEYEIIDVEWPSEESGDDDDETEDGSDVLDKKVYDNAKEQATIDKQLKPKMEDLSIGEKFTMDILESHHAGTIESRFTTATQLMVYHAILELGVPELALSRNAYRAAIIKNIKNKSQELLTSPTMKNALKQFINRSIDYEAHAHKNKTAMDKEHGKVMTQQQHESQEQDQKALTEGLTQDYWDAFNDLVNYVASTPEAAAEFMKIPQMKQLITRSSGAIRANVSSQMKVKLNDFKTALTNDGKTNQAKVAASVVESYLNHSIQLQEASPAEVTDLFNTMLSLADSSKGATLATTIMGSSAWNKFFNAAKTSLSQKFTGQVRAKLNSLKQTMPQIRVQEQKNAELAHAYSYGSEKFDAGKPIEVIGEDGDYYIVKPFPIMANGHMKLKKSAVKLTGKIEVPIGGNDGKMPGGLNEGSKQQNIEKLRKDYKTAKGWVEMARSDHERREHEKTVSRIRDHAKKQYQIDLGESLESLDDQLELQESQVPEWSFEMDEESVVIQTGNLKVKLNTEEIEKLVKGITNKDAVVVKDEEDPSHKVAFSPRGSSVMVKKVGTTEGVMMKQKDVEDFLSFVATGSDETEDEEVVADSETSPLIKKE